MSGAFDSVEDACATLANQSRVAGAFAYLSSRPETAQMTLDAFWRDLGVDGCKALGHRSGHRRPDYRLDLITQALGTPEDALSGLAVWRRGGR